jgi:hypothetical protein
MNGQIATERKGNHRSALRQVLDTMEPYLTMEHGRKKERSLMKYAILLSEAELDCIVHLCQQAVISAKRKGPKPKPLAAGRLF